MSLVFPVTIPSHGDASNIRIRTQLFDIQNYLNSGSIGIVGTITNDNAATGDIGEYVESVISSATNFPTTDTWGDLTSISLTAGDWDVSFQYDMSKNGATITDDNNAGISVTTGNSSTGLVYGSNAAHIPAPTATNGTGGCISNYRISINTTTTVYAKYRAKYSVATPQMVGRLSARRTR